jgi:hypothetical protein
LWSVKWSIPIFLESQARGAVYAACVLGGMFYVFPPRNSWKGLRHGSSVQGWSIGGCHQTADHQIQICGAWVPYLVYDLRGALGGCFLFTVFLGS